MIKKVCIDAKVSDLFNLATDTGIEYEGYVPSALGIGGGDYLSIDIDNSTGTIIGWKPLQESDILKCQ